MSEKDYDTLLQEALPWLESGDRQKISEELGLSYSYVSRCLRKNDPCRNWDVLYKAVEMAKRRKVDCVSKQEEFKRIKA